MTRMVVFLALLLLVVGACVANPPMPDAGEGVAAFERTRPYYLPFRAGTRHLCIQGVGGPFSHSGSQTYALDFRMPVGTPVLAARAGRVVGVKEDSDMGGPSRRHAAHGNRVAILHEDGTRAVYLHLRRGGALVAIGQQVQQGQAIAQSGDTGWSAMPHLHFQVDARDPRTGRWAAIPVAFHDVGGDGVPKMLTTYVSANVQAVSDTAPPVRSNGARHRAVTMPPLPPPPAWP